MRLSWLMILVALGACEYRETVGRNNKDTQADASIPGFPDAREPSATCEGFTVPSGDCTLGQGDCTFQSDCDGIDMNCNRTTRRCFRSTDRCVGTPCDFNEDCPSAERCNQATNTCYDLNSDQTCMPCFILDSNCGLERCSDMVCS